GYTHLYRPFQRRVWQVVEVGSMDPLPPQRQAVRPVVGVASPQRDDRGRLLPVKLFPLSISSSAQVSPRLWFYQHLANRPSSPLLALDPSGLREPLLRVLQSVLH